jgi:ribosomal protein L9
LGQEIDRRKIVSDPLRQVGEHLVQVRLLSEVSATIKVVIQAEGGVQEEASAGQATA